MLGSFFMLGKGIVSGDKVANTKLPLGPKVPISIRFCDSGWPRNSLDPFN